MKQKLLSEQHWDCFQWCLSNFGAKQIFIENHRHLIEVGCSSVCEQGHKAGSAITNWREPRSCLGQLFNSKLGRTATLGSNCMGCMQPLLKLKTQPRACPVS
jgi:hypothetical protein